MTAAATGGLAGVFAAFLAEPPVDLGRDEAQREAARELSRAGYQHESLVDRLWNGFTQWLGDLLDAGADSVSGAASLAGIAVILVVLAALLVWALRRMSRGHAATGAVFGQGERTAAEHRAAAERLAAEGNWTAAVQERLRAIARDLEERAIVSPLPGRTATELAEAAGRPLPSHAAELRTAARVFDDVTYGETPGTRDHYLSLTALDERLRQARVTLESPA
ncbi:DUF4129 domain-containing protein [Microbispora sp. NPDC049125]|uniref:DUF4129 domain-containing protein n=1 Tax=Microbispora sp. NPDC049125 TaxID=3154929 RepID=UPI003466435F